MNDDVCRMCLQRGAKSNFVSLNFGQPSIKSKLETVVPELNLDIIVEPVICAPCSASLENAYQLKMKCLRTEEKIWVQLQELMSTKQIPTPVRILDLIPTQEFNANLEKIMIEPNLQFYQSNNEFINNSNHINQPPINTYNNELITDIKSPPAQNEDVFTCMTCKQSFTSSNELHSHISVHLNTRPFMCSYCYKCFSLKSNLQIHVRTHTQDRPFRCEFCEKCFTTKGNLQTHVRVHTKEKPYVCELCDKAFIQKVQLNTHKLLHENEQTFSCEVCEKSFSTKGTLQVHKRIHEDIKPFVCEYCDKSFTTNGNLVVHVRTHTGEKPYKCDECHKAFAQSNQLKNHKKTHLVVGNDLHCTFKVEINSPTDIDVPQT